MKKLLFLLIALFALAAFANAQKTYTVGPDTLTDAETAYTTPISSTSSKGNLTIQATFTQISGTSAGSAYLQVSVDGVTYVDVTDVAGLFTVIPNDTVTIATGTAGIAIIEGPPGAKYRWKLVGSGTQSTEVETVYIPKLK